MPTDISGYLPGFSGLKILVTGARGFIGSRLYDVLRDSEAEVHAVSRSPQSPLMETPGWWYGDLSDIAVVRNIVLAVRPDIIFHLAGHPIATRGLEMVLPTFHSNLSTTINLLTAAEEIGCRRIVMTGSLEEPDISCGFIMPSSPYAAAKWASSVYAQMFYRLYQAPVVIARIFLTYGPGPEKHTKIIPYVVRSLLQGSAPSLSSGQRLIDFIYIDDVVGGLLAAAQAPTSVEGCIVDLGSGTLQSIRDVVEQIANLIETNVIPIFGAVPDRGVEQVRIADTASANEKIGWTPSTALRDGLERTVEWYKEQLMMC